MVMDSIKAVYASAFYKDSKAYMQATSNVIDEEKMAIVIQTVVGTEYGNRYYPTMSGVARSIDFYPIPINERISFDLNGPKIIIKYPKEEGSYDMVTMLGQKTSKFKYTFLNIFILPALSAAYDALKNAQDEDNYLTFLENHNWATIMDSHEPDWDSSKGSYELAQWFFEQMVSKNRSQMKVNTIEVPVVTSFKELQNYIS